MPKLVKYPSKLEKSAVFRRANIKAARIILADRGKYAGLPLVWAEEIYRKHIAAPSSLEPKTGDLIF